MIRTLSASVICVSCAFIIGCGSFDQNQIITHPESVRPSSTFDVALINTFMYLDSNSTMTSTVERDSLHLLVGTPESWQVVEAKLAVVSDADMTTMMAIEDESLAEEMADEMLEQYRAEAVAMRSDASLPDAISGMTINALDQEGSEDSLEVEVDNVDNWIGLSGPVNIVLEQGSELDTTLSLDSLSAMMGEEDILDPAYQAFLPDSMGMTIRPILIYLKIKAAGQENIDTLYYYTKTGSMDLEAGAGTNPLTGDMNLDVGAMRYVPITVTNTAEVQKRKVVFAASAVTIINDRSTGGVTIDLGSINPRQASIGIYSLAGELVRTLTPDRITCWNGVDEHGKRVGIGNYLVKIGTADGGTVRNVQLVR
jgi:hypothetical protein